MAALATYNLKSVQSKVRVLDFDTVVRKCLLLTQNLVVLYLRAHRGLEFDYPGLKMGLELSAGLVRAVAQEI